MPLNIGIPQESVLGPLLFVIYICDITHNFSYLVLYDDLQLYLTFPLYMLQQFADIMSEYATHISNLATRNRLRLNIAKTKAIVIGSYHYINQLPSMQTRGVTLNQTLNLRHRYTAY